MRLINLDQRSPDWSVWRLKGIGSSDAPVIWNGKHFGKTVDRLRRDKAAALLGLEVREGAASPAMRRGIEAEGTILDRYRAYAGWDARPCCGVHDLHWWIKASFDGLHDHPELGPVPVEAKTPGTRKDGSNDHHDALRGLIPEKYLPQLDHQLLVCGGALAHYASYCPDFPLLDRLRVIPYRPDPGRLARLLALEKEFWWEAHDLAGLEPPEDLAGFEPEWVCSWPHKHPEGAATLGPG